MKTILLTGVTGAVGQAACKSLAARGNMKLLLLGRNHDRLNEFAATLPGVANRIDILTADLSDLRSVHNILQVIKKSYTQLDALVNIASVFKAKQTFTPQHYETMLATNHLGPFMLTTGLLDLLKRTPGSKVITVAAPSAMRIDFDNLNSEKRFSSLRAFGSSKMMNLLMAFGLSAAFKNSDHASLAFHPGLVRSELMRECPPMLRKVIHAFSSDADKTGRAITELILSPETTMQNGKFYNRNLRELQASSHAYDRVVQHKLWKASESLTSVLHTSVT